MQESMQQLEQLQQLTQSWFDTLSFANLPFLIVLAFIREPIKSLLFFDFVNIPAINIYFSVTVYTSLCMTLLFQTLSSWATSSVEEVASTGPGVRFFQLYVSLRWFPAPNF